MELGMFCMDPKITGFRKSWRKRGIWQERLTETEEAARRKMEELKLKGKEEHKEAEGRETQQSKDAPGVK